jgi:type I restriction enzyme S subunit
MEWESEPLVDIVESLHQGLNTAGEKIKFEDVGFPIIQTRNIDNGQINLDHKIKFMSQGDWDKYNEKYKPQVGDVFFTNIGTIGKTAIVHVEQDYLIHWNIFKIRPIPDKITSAYLKYRLDYLTDTGFFTASQKGGTVNFVTKKMMSSVEVPLPPIPEQKRIVAILDQAFADIEQARAKTKQNLKNARELFESYLQQVFSQRGEGWVEKSLGNAAEVSTGGTPLKSKSEFWDGDIPWYSSGELNDTFTIESKRCITVAGLDGSNAKLFPEGSLLVGMYDTAALKMSILDREGAFNQAIAGVKPNNKINLEFILHSINSIKPELLKLRRGVRQKNLNQSKIKGIPIRLPSLSEQNQVVEELRLIRRSTDDLAVIYTQKLNDLDELKKSILQKAFSGELTKTLDGDTNKGAAA